MKETIEQCAFEACLETRQFLHRFLDATFLPMVSPNDIGGDVASAAEHDIVAGFKPSMAASFDAALWKKWKPVEEVVDEVGGDRLQAFSTFFI